MINIIFDEQGNIIGSTEATVKNMVEVDEALAADIFANEGKYKVESYEVENIGDSSEIVTITSYRVVLNPNYEQELAEKEAQRIAMLNLTAADVERGLYKALKIDFEDIIEQVDRLNNSNVDEDTSSQPSPQEEGAKIDIKALKIELKANNFYRGNPYIDAVGGLLGLSKEQLDKFFETNDYNYLLPKESEEADEAHSLL